MDGTVWIQVYFREYKLSWGKKDWALLHANTNAAFYLNYLTSISSYNLF